MTKPTTPAFEAGKYYSRKQPNDYQRDLMCVGRVSDISDPNVRAVPTTVSRYHRDYGANWVFMSLHHASFPVLYVVSDAGVGYEVSSSSGSGTLSIGAEWAPPVYSYINVYKGRPLGSAFTDIELSVSEAQVVVKEGEFEYLQTLKIEPISSSTATFKHEAAKVFGLKK